MRKSWLLVKTTIIDQFRNSDFLVVIALLLGYYSFNFPYSCRSLMEESGTINPLAPFVSSFFNRDSVLITYAGLIMMMGDMTEKIKDRIFRILRMNRKDWIKGQMLGMAAGVFLYFLTVLILTVLFFIPVLEFTFSWGSGIGIEPTLLGTNLPITFLKTWLLVVLLGILFGSICLLAEAFGNKRMGPAICAALMIWDLLLGDFNMRSNYISPVGMLQNCVEGNALFTAIYYIFLITVILNVTWIVNEKKDVNI